MPLEYYAVGPHPAAQEVIIPNDLQGSSPDLKPIEDELISRGSLKRNGADGMWLSLDDIA